MVRSYFVYILGCSDNSYYVGMTDNMERRFGEHQDGRYPSCYTVKRRPVVLLHVEPYPDVLQAGAREKQLKGWSRMKKEALIKGDLAAMSFHALAYERRTFPPLSKELRERVKREPSRTD